MVKSNYNQQNIQKELHWLKEVIQVRIDFQYHHTSKMVAIPSLHFRVMIDRKQAEVLPEKSLFVVQKNEANRAWYVALYETPELANFKRHNDCLCALKEGTPLLKLLEVQEEWVLVEVTCELVHPDSHQIDRQKSVKAWLPRCFTNIPLGYHPTMPLLALKNLSGKLTEVEYATLQHYLEVRDQNAYWQKFYRARNITQLSPPQLSNDHSPYAQFINQNKLNFYDRLLLIMSLTAQLEPDFFQESLLAKYNDALSTIGLLSGVHYQGLFPSGVTFLFLSNVHNLQTRIERLKWMKQKSTLLANKVVTLSSVAPFEPMWAGGLVIDQDYFISLTDIDVTLKTTSLYFS